MPAEVVVHSPTPSRVLHGGLFERRGKERGRRVALMVIGVQSRASQSMSGSISARLCRSRRFWNSFSLSHSGIESRNDE